ncbi:hypothetical protein Cgig2_031164 [Carnegiea gigantea]|uniref:Uncharacterized protein n=1 Tax=Carnegiea gigantea TaxID=171969 RepID=A0A9Q1KN21_9CARY|nr:hypothetical protein Cgig2_031164 [Carnegiea gigantea]
MGKLTWGGTLVEIVGFKLFNRPKSILPVSPTQPTRHSSSGTSVYAPPVSWRWWNFGVVWTDRGFGKTKEDEGSQYKPSSVARVAHAPPICFGSDGRGGVAISGVVWADRGFGKMKKEKGSQWTPSSVVCVAHVPFLLSGSDGRGVWKDKGRGDYLNVMGNEAVKAAFEEA